MDFVIDAETARAAILAGAEFIVAPTLNPAEIGGAAYIKAVLALGFVEAVRQARGVPS